MTEEQMKKIEILGNLAQLHSKYLEEQTAINKLGLELSIITNEQFINHRIAIATLEARISTLEKKGMN